MSCDQNAVLKKNPKSTDNKKKFSIKADKSARHNYECASGQHVKPFVGAAKKKKPVVSDGNGLF